MALLASLGTYLLALASSVQQLPATVASHFDAHGDANGWMDRTLFLLMMVLVGLLMPGMALLLRVLLRWLPASQINLPNREYWLAPERRAETIAEIPRRFLWLSCWTLVFLLGIHMLVVDANQRNPNHLSSAIWVLLVAYLVSIAIWVAALVRHFRRVPAGTP
jgi:serine/threonine-protein kinase